MPQDSRQVLLRVYLDSTQKRHTEVPITPSTTFADVIECAKAPGEDGVYLLELWQGRERVLPVDGKPYDLIQRWNQLDEDVRFYLRYTVQNDIADQPGRRHGDKRRNGMRDQHSSDSMLPGGVELTLTELQEMATRQQQQIEVQAQQLVAKEQRLKFLKQQELRHQQIASENERLRRLREKVDAQELKLKKLRALRGQVDTNKASNNNLSAELETIKALFSEKEKELSAAVARVDELTNQLEALRNGSAESHKPVTSAASPAIPELDKLRKELAERNMLNEQQNTKLLAHQEVLNARKQEMSNMDKRIAELQNRLRRKQQMSKAPSVKPAFPATAPSTRPKPNVAAVEPYIQQAPVSTAPTEEKSAFNRGNEDPKYQTLPYSMKLGPNASNTIVAENNNNKDDQQSPSKGGDNFKTSVGHSTAFKAMQDELDHVEKQTSPVTSPLKKRPVSTRSNAALMQTFAPRPFVGSSSSSSSAKATVTNATDAPVLDSTLAVHDGPPSPGPKTSTPMSSGQQLPKQDPDNTQEIFITNAPVMSTRINARAQPMPVTSLPSSEASDPPRPPPPPYGYRPPASVYSVTAVTQVQPARSRADDVTSSHQPPPPPYSKSSGTSSPSNSSFSPSATQQLQSPLADVHNNSASSAESDTSRTSSLSGKRDGRLDTARREMRPDADSTDSSKRFLATSEPAVSSALTALRTSSATAPSSKPTYRYAPRSVITNMYLRKLGGGREQLRKNMGAAYKDFTSAQRRAETEATDGDKSADSARPFVDGSPLQSRHPEDSPTATVYPLPAEGEPDLQHRPLSPTRLLSPAQGVAHAPRPLRRRLSMEAVHQQFVADDVTTTTKPEAPSSFRPAMEPVRVETVTDFTGNGMTSPKEGSPTGAYSPETDSIPFADASSTAQEKSDAAHAPRAPKGIVKRADSAKHSRRVSFDPLALLLDASLEGELELVKRTAKQVADPSAANDEGITALHNAICAGHFEIVRFLVEFGCNVNSPDSDGWTPLHCAASCNNLPMVRLLVEHGACIFAATISDNETAAEKCEEDEDGYDGCSEYLYCVQEKLGIANGGAVYAVFDYDSMQQDELSFSNGDKLVIIRKGDDKERDWYWASLRSKEGYIPRNLLGMHPRTKL